MTASAPSTEKTCRSGLVEERRSLKSLLSLFDMIFNVSDFRVYAHRSKQFHVILGEDNMR
jgi:hypothetical protein